MPSASFDGLAPATGDQYRALLAVSQAIVAHRAPLASRAIMTLPQPTAFSALIHGHDGECPCCRRPFADAG